MITTVLRIYLYAINTQDQIVSKVSFNSLTVYPSSAPLKAQFNYSCDLSRRN